MTESHATPARPLRADARRNYDRLLAAAAAAVARDGAGASLEEIARQAGVGSATLHRHFASRQALLNAVFHERVEDLCRRAHEQTGAADPGAALVAWLQDLGAYVASTRGLASSLLQDATAAGNTCFELISEAGDALLTEARAAGAVRAGVSVVDLIKLVTAISLATESSPGEAGRLLGLALDGIRPLPQP